MTYILAVVGAITSATRLASHLEEIGCRNIKVIRTPINISSGGCSYSVRMGEENLDKLRIVSSNRRFKIKKIYKVTEKDRESEYYDIS